MNTAAKFLCLVWFVRIVAHGPAECLDPGLHNVRRPPDAVELGAVAEHGYNISRVFLLVPHELEGNTPKHGDTNDQETG